MTAVEAIESFRKVVKEAQAGDNVGLFLRGVERGQLAKGDVFVAAS